MRAAVLAGYRATAVDIFCDADTCAHAGLALQVPFVDGGFDAVALRRLLLSRLAAVEGFVYGSGFETQPELLQEIAGYCPVIGNTAETVRRVKDHALFFPLLDALGIPHPLTALHAPQPADGWLQKRRGGSGGTHVARAGAETAACHYYQKCVTGRPCSVLFLADGSDIRPVGFHEQWIAPAPGQPYRYGGAVSGVRLPAAASRTMLEAAGAITRAAGLRGLNSLDCIVEDAQCLVLEVNPRLSGTFALHDRQRAGSALFEAHLRACRGDLAWTTQGERPCAHLIYYAPFDVTVPDGVRWPSWAADLPPAGGRVAAGDPLCSLFAEADDAEAAGALAADRARILQRQLDQWVEREQS